MGNKGRSTIGTLQTTSHASPFDHPPSSRPYLRSSAFICGFKTCFSLRPRCVLCVSAVRSSPADTPLLYRELAARRVDLLAALLALRHGHPVLLQHPAEVAH